MNKSKIKAIFSSNLLLVLLIVILTNGCKKINPETAINKEETEIALIQLAKKHFKDMLNAEKQSSVQISDKGQKTVSSRSTPLFKMDPNILWDAAIHRETEEFDYLVIPLKEKIKPFRNQSYEYFRNILFYQDKEGNSNMIIMEVLSKKYESLGKDLDKIAITAFENKNFSRIDEIDKINASIIFFDQNYTQESSYQIKEGRWEKARILFRSDLDITQ